MTDLRFINGKILYRYSADVVNSYLSKDVSKGVNNSIIFFDTEAYSHSPEISITYIWTVCINGAVFYGRTVDELKSFFTQLSQNEHKFIIFIHGLNYDMYYIDSALGGISVDIARESHKPLEAHWKNIILRCTHALTNLKLEEIAKRYNLQERKLTMDYKLPRTPYTPLTDDELAYCINDVLIGYEYIKMISVDYESLEDIPRTFTGLSGRKHYEYYKDLCGYTPYDKCGNPLTKATLKNEKEWFRTKSYNLITESGKELHKITSKTTYGAFLYIDPLSNGEAHFATDRVYLVSADIHSDYPYQVLAHKYSNTFTKVYNINTLKQFLYRTKTDYGFAYFTLPFIKLKTDGFPFLHKDCIVDRHAENITYQIGTDRLISANNITLALNSVDLQTLMENYDFDHNAVILSNVFVGRDTSYQKPQTLKYIAKLYNDKTQFKDVVGKEKEYEESKTIINAYPGMCQLDISKNFYKYNNNRWQEDTTTTIEQKSARRYYRTGGRNAQFVLFQWGGFITAHARQCLIRLNKRLSEVCTILYNDTDGLKAIIYGNKNYEKFKQILAEYNVEVRRNLEAMCAWVYQRTGGKIQITTEELAPKGQLIGTIDIEAEYTAFKYLAPKLYLTCETVTIDNKPYHKLRVVSSGINKKSLMKELIKDIEPDYKCDLNNVTYVHYTQSDLQEIFDRFSDDLIVPEGRTVHYYTQPKEVTITDYLGNTNTFMTTKGVAIFEQEKRIKDNPLSVFKGFVYQSNKPTTN